MARISLAAEVIQEARSRSGLSLRELARRAGTSPGTLHRYERGAVNPTMSTVERIVAACGLELRVVMDHPDPSDAITAAALATLTPEQRLITLSAWARMRDAATS